MVFLRLITIVVADYDAAIGARAGVDFVGSPRREPYGQVAVFRDIAGNLWDLVTPA